MNAVLSRPIDWVDTACPLCSTQRFDAVIEATDPLLPSQVRFRVVRCRFCELSYTNPRPSVSSIGQFYPENYSCYQSRALPNPRWRPWARRSPLTPIGSAPPGGRLLDFGCGAGELLQEYQRLGWHVTGMDLSPRMVRHVRDHLALPALEGTLPHPNLRPGSFDAITMTQSLEHVHDPLGVLRAANRLLTPGGKVVIAVPNIDSLPFQWFGADWYGLDLPRHLTHFTPRTLVAMLEYSGFRVGSIHLLRHNSWLRRSAQMASRHPDSPTWWQRLLRHRMLASLAGLYSAARKQANCILAVGIQTAVPCDVRLPEAVPTPQLQMAAS